MLCMHAAAHALPEIQQLSPKLSPVLRNVTSVLLEALKIVERVKGIEPSLSAWET